MFVLNLCLYLTTHTLNVHSLEPFLSISSKEPDFLVISKVVLGDSSSGFLKVF